VNKLILSGLLALVALAACACGYRPSARPTLKIGLVAPFEGLYRPLGYDALYGVRLAIEERNDLGGVGGYLVELVALNDDQDPLWAVQRAREMCLDPDVMGVIGHMGDETTRAAIPVYREANLPLVVPCSGADTFMDGRNERVFWLVADNETVGSAAARYAVLERGTGSVGVAGGGDGLLEAFVATSSALGAEVAVGDGQEAQDLIAGTGSPQIDLLFLSLEGPKAAELLVELRREGWEVPVLGGPELDTPQFAQIAGEAARGTTYLSYVPPVGESAFAEAFQGRWGAAPSSQATLAYEAARVLLDALDRCIALYGEPSRQGVADALARTDDYWGLTGRITFDEKGQALDRQVYLYQLVEPAYPGEMVPCLACSP